jgi:hypothetical protein
MIKITTGIPARDQESSFMNSCLAGFGANAMSIAVRPPERFSEMDEDVAAEQLKSDFAWLSEQGYEIEVQIGPDTGLDGEG